MRNNGIESRLNIILEKINRMLVTCKTYVVKNTKERDKIINKASKDKGEYSDLIQARNLIVIIDCGKYEGKKPM